ncbi:MAG TPA: Na+:solute symporter [Phaeodactylibacter sp.]|nr:Na+:solute symporter [Phaeodactylibacter sp.]
MHLSQLDWTIIFAFFLISLLIGLLTGRQAGRGYTDYFLSGRNMPWWLLGVSMVATTFSADTPNLVTDIVRQNGVAGNWVWWAFLLTGMLTVFVYARLWRRSKVLTDLEFYELRYSGPEAAFLRAFRAFYLGVFFNAMIMATVILAAIKISGVIFPDLDPWKVTLFVLGITALYTTLGGLRGVLLTDLVQFVVAMGGTIWAAYILVNQPEIGGLQALFQNEAVQSRLSLLPDFKDTAAVVPLLIIPLAVQWWSVWYPGAEPGGGGYIVQRMLAAKDEKNAMGATLFFNIAHYALRPWPWIIIAFCSLVMYPDLSSLHEAFPNMIESKIGHDMAYPAMLTHLPKGLIGLVVASLLAAFMSTISTHLNWGSSYVAYDLWHRFIQPYASNRELVIVGRISTLLLLALSALIAHALLNNALQSFQILLQIGAGTGLLFILRWFWWRINAFSEITAMVASFLVALYLHKWGPEDMEDHWKLLYGVGLTTLTWVGVTLFTHTPPTEQLIRFFKRVRPHPWGWQPIIRAGLRSGIIRDEHLKTGSFALELSGMFVGCFTVYAALFGTGYWIYGRTIPALAATVITAMGGYLLFRIWGALNE